MSADNKRIKKYIGVSIAVLGTAFAGLGLLAKKKKSDSIYKNDVGQKNPLEGKKVVFVEDENDAENADGVKGHLEAIGDSEHHPGLFERAIG